MAGHLSLKRIFNRYNRLYFNNELSATTAIVWKPLNGKNGETDCETIWLDPSLAMFPRFLRIVLLHEMAHVKHRRAMHGKVWQAEIDRLYSLGAFRDLI